MARIIYTALVESIRGSIKGTTFQRNAYGHTVKAKPNMVNPNTRSQLSRKTAFGQAIQEWKNLTDSQRNNWNTYATTFPVPTRLNSSSYLNGFNAFGRRLAAAAPLGAGGIPSDPDSTQGVIGPYQLDLILSGGDFIIGWDFDPTEGPWYVMFYMTRPLTPTQKFNKSWARFVNGTFVTGPDELGVSALYAFVFGAIPVVGDLIGVQVVFYNQVNGQVVYSQPVIQAVTT